MNNLTNNPFSGRRLRILVPKFKIYVDNADGWRWRIKSANGEIVGAATETFSSKQAALENFKLLGKMIMDYCEAEKNKP